MMWEMSTHSVNTSKAYLLASFYSYIEIMGSTWARKYMNPSSSFMIPSCT